MNPDKTNLETDSGNSDDHAIRCRDATAPHAGLIQILNVFRKRNDPQSRVFAGMMFDSEWNREKPGEHVDESLAVTASGECQNQPNFFPLFSGVATPGSRVDVSLVNEVGMVEYSTTVYTDAAGNWLAPFEMAEIADTTWQVDIKILPEAWGGNVEPRCLMISFPGAKILSHNAAKNPETGELFGGVFATGESWGTPT